MPWDLTGNSGTNPATDFLGTTDNQPLVIRTNGAEALRIDSEVLSNVVDWLLQSRGVLLLASFD
jgi:hypothetical protein